MSINDNLFGAVIWNNGEIVILEFTFDIEFYAKAFPLLHLLEYR